MKSEEKREDKQNRICIVCGDIAIGYNFGALTCESCKAFFRRNAFKSDKLYCLFASNCNVDKITRRFCAFCRLKKCLQIGMKKEFILGEDQKRLRHEKARLKLEKKILKRCKQDKMDALKVNQLSRAMRLDSTQLNSLKDRDASDQKALNGQKLFPGMSFCMDDLNNFLISYNESTAFSENHSSSEQSASGNFNSTTNPLPFDYPNKICLNEKLSEFGQCRILTSEQWAAINSLRVAYEKSFYSTVCEETPAGATSINNFVNKSGSIVKKMITFSKEFSQFLTLQQENQITLLRGVVGHTLLLISATHYDVENDLWRTPQGRIPTRILTLVSQFNGLYEEHTHYCRLFRDLVGHDIQIIASMLILCLFCPDNISLIERDVVSRTHDHFVLLLKHYLEAQYGYRNSRTILPRVLDCLDKMQKIVDNHSKVLVSVDPSQIDPLMLEILNIQENRELVAIQNGIFP